MVSVSLTVALRCRGLGLCEREDAYGNGSRRRENATRTGVLGAAGRHAAAPKQNTVLRHRISSRPQYSRGVLQPTRGE